jgi:hypothetical protein
MNVQVLYAEVPARHQGIATGSDLPEAVVLRAMVADLRSLRMIDMDRIDGPIPGTSIAWRRNAHTAQDTGTMPHLPGTARSALWTVRLSWRPQPLLVLLASRAHDHEVAALRPGAT